MVPRSCIRTKGTQDTILTFSQLFRRHTHSHAHAFTPLTSITQFNPLDPSGPAIPCTCGTVSNVLEKSRMAMSTCCPLSCSCRKSLIVVISWVSQEYPDLKPWFKFVRILFFSRRFRRCLQMMCSSILQVTDVSDTGL